SSRIHPHGLSRVARERHQREYSRRHSLSRAGPRTALSHAGYAPDRHRALRRRATVALEGPRTGVHCARGSIGRGAYRNSAALTSLSELADSRIRDTAIIGDATPHITSARSKLLGDTNHDFLIHQKTCGRRASE